MVQKSKKGMMGNVFDAMVNARSRQISAYVNGALLMLDDDTLKANGYDREELRRRPSAVYPL